MQLFNFLKREKKEQAALQARENSENIMAPQRMQPQQLQQLEEGTPVSVRTEIRTPHTQESNPPPEVSVTSEESLPRPISETMQPTSTVVSVSDSEPSPPPSALQQWKGKTPLRQNVEGILAEGLADVFAHMSFEDQEKFRAKGEETATILETLVAQLKATSKRVVQLIRAWLLLIPHVNKFFLDQETKIKTDYVLALQEKMRKEGNNEKF